MADPSSGTTYQRRQLNRVLRDLGRAFAGALIFSLPMLMTMELWTQGIYLERYRLLGLLSVSLPLLVFLSRHFGFEKTRTLLDDIIDTFIAIGVAALCSFIVLILFGVITGDTSSDGVAGQLVLQTVPAAVGALLAKSQMGADDKNDEEDQPQERYFSELAIMALGAVFFGLNIAPTDEVVVIASQIDALHALGLILFTITLMHGFVFTVGFRGGSSSSTEGFLSLFLKETLPGYVVALLVAFFMLWVFARTDGASPQSLLISTVVLGFPCGLGASAARLIL